MDNALAFESAPPIDVPRLHDRQSDNWEPLAQIARIAGGVWPESVLQAAAVLSGAAEKMADESIPIDLMSDIRHLFMTEDTDRLGSQHIADALAKLEGRPWPEFRGGKSITTNQVAHLLKPYQVRPHNVRIGEEILKGYLLGDFEDAFSRYLPPTDRYVATNIEKQ
jgi:putative DNA primase/helicase